MAHAGRGLGDPDGEGVAAPEHLGADVDGVRRAVHVGAAAGPDHRAAPEHDERLGLVRLERRLGPCEEATGEGAPGVARRSDDRAAFEGEAQHLLAVAREPRLAAGAAGVGRGHVVLASIAPGGGVRDREPGEVEEMGALAANVGVLPDRGAPR